MREVILSRPSNSESDPFLSLLMDYIEKNREERDRKQQKQIFAMDIPLNRGTVTFRTTNEKLALGFMRMVALAGLPCVQAYAKILLRELGSDDEIFVEFEGSENHNEKPILLSKNGTILQFELV